MDGHFSIGDISKQSTGQGKNILNNINHFGNASQTHSELSTSVSVAISKM